MSLSYPTVLLKSGRDKSTRLRHPRLFSGAIKQIQGDPQDGAIVDVCSTSGEWLARGILNRQAQIAVRLLTWEPEEAIDPAFWQRRVHSAIQRRQSDPTLQKTNARRLIFSESDGLPGIIADQYAEHVVVQVSTLGGSQALQAVMAALRETIAPRSIVIRGDEDRLKYETSTELEQVGWGACPTEPVAIAEHGAQFRVNLSAGQKTGFYLDQRENRLRVAHYCQGASVLNSFSYTGAFGVYAALARAKRIVHVDASADALALAEQHTLLNPGSTDCQVEFICADAFDDVRSRRAQGEQFDVVILDPPKFAHSPSQVQKAARAYKDLNRIGLLLVKPGGILATFSCSGVVDAALFQKIIFSATIEARRSAQVVERLTQASDHPVLLTFPEAEYLKGLILRVE
jgi:23S rRNA (cytosine1962-C5)-methyltransferase